MICRIIQPTPTFGHLPIGAAEIPALALLPGPSQRSQPSSIRKTYCPPFQSLE
jgi:hypothetical protein